VSGDELISRHCLLCSTRIFSDGTELHSVQKHVFGVPCKSCIDDGSTAEEIRERGLECGSNFNDVIILVIFANFSGYMNVCVLRAKRVKAGFTSNFYTFYSLRRLAFASDLIRSTRSSVPMKALGQLSRKIEVL
jgi:hypothetical protein